MPQPVFGQGSGATNGYTARYVSSQASGTGNGTTSTIGGANGAWTFGQSIASLAAGQVAFIMDDGTYLLSSAFQPTNSGSVGSGLVVYAGINNLNGANANGGRPLMDWQNNAVTGINAGTPTGLWFENLELKRANIGISITTGTLIYNCLIHNCISDGISIAGSGLCLMSDSYSNGGHGINLGGAASKALLCRAFSNTGSGIRCANVANMPALCETFANTLRGIDATIGGTCPVVMCTIDGNTTEGVEYGNFVSGLVLACCITNQNQLTRLGIKAAAPLTVLSLLNQFFTNTTDRTAGILSAGDQTGDPKYANRGANDFSILQDSPARATALQTSFAGTDCYVERGAVQRHGANLPRVVGGY